jgi:hypothetical protein
MNPRPSKQERIIIKSTVAIRYQIDEGVNQGPGSVYMYWIRQFPNKKSLKIQTPSQFSTIHVSSSKHKSLKKTTYQNRKYSNLRHQPPNLPRLTTSPSQPTRRQTPSTTQSNQNLHLKPKNKNVKHQTATKMALCRPDCAGKSQLQTCSSGPTGAADFQGGSGYSADKGV